MKWSELSIRAPSEYAEPLSEFFRRYGQGGVAIEQLGDDHGPAASSTLVTVRTYLPLDAAYRHRKAMIEVGVRLVSHIQSLGDLQERVLEEDKWESAWKAHFTLLRIGHRLVLVPGWQEYAPRQDEAVVTLEPGMAFGTGHHPTTRMCLEQLDKHVVPGARLLDLGTGSGILSIAAIKLGAREAVALDIDSVAVKSARDNLRANGIGRSVKVVRGTLPHPQVAPGSFDLGVANVTAKVLVDRAKPLADSIAPRGILVLSGIIQEHLGEVEAALAPMNVAILERLTDGDWVTLVAKKDHQ